jgi:flagella basal body P-ring formation protein FlgA
MRTVVFATAALFAAAAPAHGLEASLRPRIEASGPAVTLGDVFENAGPMAGRAVATAPAPGGRSTLSARFLAAAAQAAGLDWTPPAGVDSVTILRPSAAPGARAQPAAFSQAAPVIKRGDIVTLVFVAPGVQLMTKAKAVSDAALGAPVRLVNLASNRTVDAVATGPDEASASNTQTY